MLRDQVLVFGVLLAVGGLHLPKGRPVLERLLWAEPRRRIGLQQLRRQVTRRLRQSHAEDSEKESEKQGQQAGFAIANYREKHPTLHFLHFDRPDLANCDG